MKYFTLIYSSLFLFYFYIFRLDSPLYNRDPFNINPPFTKRKLFLLKEELKSNRIYGKSKQVLSLNLSLLCNMGVKRFTRF